jgi:hypothetical protein
MVPRSAAGDVQCQLDGVSLTNIGIVSARALKMKIEPLHSNYSCIRSRYTVRDMVVLNKT